MGAVFKAIAYKSASEEVGNIPVPKSFFEFKIRDIQGEMVDFHSFKNKKAILIVNVACK